MDFGAGVADANLQVYNQGGQLVQSISCEGQHQVKLELKGPSGLYWVAIISPNGQRVTKRVIKL